MIEYRIRCLRRRQGWTRPRRWAAKCEHDLIVSFLDKEWHCRYARGRGYYPLSATRVSGQDRVVLAQYDRPEWKMKRKAVGGGASESPHRHLAAVETNVFGRLMNLVEHCSVTKYDDGSPRKPGWFTLKTLGSAWVVQVKDPDGCCQLNATAQTVDDALALADVLLGSEEAPWEPDPFLRARTPKKAG